MDHGFATYTLTLDQILASISSVDASLRGVLPLCDVPDYGLERRDAVGIVAALRAGLG